MKKIFCVFCVFCVLLLPSCTVSPETKGAIRDAFLKEVLPQVLPIIIDRLKQEIKEHKLPDPGPGEPSQRQIILGVTK